MNKGFFITGTDTGVGKTWATLALMAHLQGEGRQVLGMKPVASGCEQTDAGLRNEDALLIQRQGSTLQPYETINPYAFTPPIAPHLAAAQAGTPIGIATIRQGHAQLAAQAEWVIVEGAGGWLVPLNARDTIADLARALGLPVILVVGLRLGCINHALLSAQAIRASGCQLAGWIANPLEAQMPQREENIESIAQRIGTPLIATLPHLPSPDARLLASHFTLPEAYR